MALKHREYVALLLLAAPFFTGFHSKQTHRTDLAIASSQMHFLIQPGLKPAASRIQDCVHYIHLLAKDYNRLTYDKVVFFTAFLLHAFELIKT